MIKIIFLHDLVHKRMSNIQNSCYCEHYSMFSLNNGINEMFCQCARVN